MKKNGKEDLYMKAPKVFSIITAIVIVVWAFTACQPEKSSQTEKLYAKLKDSTDCTFITYEDDSHSDVKPEDYQTIRDWLNQE